MLPDGCGRNLLCPGRVKTLPYKVILISNENDEWNILHFHSTEIIMRRQLDSAVRRYLSDEIFLSENSISVRYVPAIAGKLLESAPGFCR